MNSGALTETAQALVADQRGLLAMDESTPTWNKRFAAAKARRAYRELIVTTPDLGEFVRGAIHFDEGPAASRAVQSGGARRPLPGDDGKGKIRKDSAAMKAVHKVAWIEACELEL